MRAIRGLWRWRRNPLCRGTDLAESWVALAAALLIVGGAPVAGMAVGSVAQDALRQTVLEQHQHRHLVPARVVRSLPQPPVDPDPETSSARDAHRRVVASWPAPDGGTRTGSVLADHEMLPGDRFRIWTDDHGRIVPRPMDSTTADAQAALAGLGTGAAAAGLVEGARRLVVWRLMHRRFEQWDREWLRAGQTWGRTGADS